MATIYQVMRDPDGFVKLKASWEGSSLGSGVTDVCSLVVEEAVWLIVLSKGAKQITGLSVSADGMALTQVFQAQTYEAYDFLSPMTIGGAPHLLAYAAEIGVLDFYRVTQAGVARIFRYQRTYGLTTTQFTMVHAYAQHGQMLVLGYNAKTGQATLYQLQVTAEVALSARDVWQASWAEGWERFAFFALGGENFFLKTNAKYNTSYIDHLYDDTSRGSHPVAKGLPLTTETSIVQMFVFEGNLHFLAYQRDGSVDINRLHSDCQGWTGVAQSRLSANALLSTAFQLNAQPFVLLA